MLKLNEFFYLMLKKKNLTSKFKNQDFKRILLYFKKLKDFLKLMNVHIYLASLFHKFYNINFNVKLPNNFLNITNKQ